jgi:uncharacterized membrane protein YbaN (DUF454 family)
MSSITVFPWESFAGTPSSLFHPLHPAESAAIPSDDDETSRGEECSERTITRDHLGPEVWIECDERMGVAQIHDPRLFRPGLVAFCRAVVHEAIERFGALRVEICLRSSLCRLEFEPGILNRTEIAERLAATVRAATLVFRSQDNLRPQLGRWWFRLTAPSAAPRVELQQTPDDSAEQIVLIQAHATTVEPSDVYKNPAPLLNLALAGGSLVMAAAGAILPGIPALPFLILAANRAARVSPELDQWLKHYPWCHALLRRASGTGSLVPGDWRSLLKMLLITAVAGAAMALVHPPLPVMIGIEIGIVAFACLREANLLSSGEELAAALG